MSVEMPSDFVVKVRTEMAKNGYRISDYAKMLTPVKVAQCLAKEIEEQKHPELDASSIALDRITKAQTAKLIRDLVMITARMAEVDQGQEMFHAQENAILSVNHAIWSTRLDTIQRLRVLMHLPELNDEHVFVSEVKVLAAGDVVTKNTHHELSKFLIGAWEGTKRRGLQHKEQVH